MKTYKLQTLSKRILADTITPVSFFLKIRDVFPHSVLLESSDYHGSKGSFSFICFKPIAHFSVTKNDILREFPGQAPEKIEIKQVDTVYNELNAFLSSFEAKDNNIPVNGIFGYNCYDAVQHFESIKFRSRPEDNDAIPQMRYSVYKYIIAINHFQNNLFIIENLLEGETSEIDRIETLLSNRNYAAFHFYPDGSEKSNITDKEYIDMVAKGKEHCFRGDVFQIVLSRQFQQGFHGDEFNVYRALRSINPSPYLFYFDYGSYKIFGSSPEAQLEIKGNKAYIHPIAGTFRRTGNDDHDKRLAEELSSDPKENAEHVMLVDLARNDLSRNASEVTVETYKEIQFYSHVLHMVSKVSGNLPTGTNRIKVMTDSFPAGTLSGAPKFKAMELIDQIEKTARGFYGGSIGYIGFNGDFNQAIMIRSFLSKNNTLFYQAGAGIVSESIEEKELQEVNNKLMALKNAMIMAKEI
jgi:anthranilate synthase component 1